MPDRATPVWATPRVLVLVACLVLLGGAWTLASPVASSPDDDFHLGSVWCGRLAGDEFCRDLGNGTGDGSRAVEVPSLVGPPMTCYAFDSTQSAACQDGVSADDVSVSRANDGLYPDGYYTLMSFFVSDDSIRSVLLMRMVTWLLCVALVVGSAIVAESTLRRAYLLAMLGTSIPLAIFLFASNNPSGIVVAGVGAFWCCGNSLLQAPTRRRQIEAGVLGAVAGLLAMTSRGDGGLYLAAAAACVIIVQRGWRREQTATSSMVVGVGILGLLVTATAGQTSDAAAGMSPETARPLGEVLWFNIVHLPSLWSGALGTWGLGWLDAAMPAVVSFSMMLLAGALVLYGLSRLDRPKLVAVGVCTFTIVAVPMYVLGSGRSIVGENVQPRYILPMLPVLLGVLLQGLPGRSLPRLTRPQTIWLVALPIGAHAVALHANIRRYVSGQDIVDFDLGVGLEWWWDLPVGPMGVWLAGSLLFGACVVLGVFPSARTSAQQRAVRSPAEYE